MHLGISKASWHGEADLGKQWKVNFQENHAIAPQNLGVLGLIPGPKSEVPSEK